jgi:ankyrin repeat protein
MGTVNRDPDIRRAAVEASEAAALTAALDAGADPDARYIDELTPLHRAIRKGSLPLVRLLLSRGASVSATSTSDFRQTGKNAYHYAALSTPEIMAELLKHPGCAAAEEFYKDHDKPRGVLHVALRAESRAMVELLLDHGLSPNAQDDSGETPLHFILGNRKSVEGALPLVRLLIERGADIDAKGGNYWDETPLFAAVRDSFTPAVALLLDLGCDAAQKSRLGDTLLHLAAERYDAKIVTMLLARGAKLEEKNRIGRTALHIAAHANRLEVVKALLDAGADPLSTDRAGKTPDQLCLADFQKGVHRLLLERQEALQQPHRALPGYHARRQEAAAKNHPFRRFGNRR